MLTDELYIVCPGHPAPKGSLKCIGRQGAAHILIEDNPRTKIWRSTVAGWITRHTSPEHNAEPKQPLGAECTFTLPRPKGHMGTGKNADLVKKSAPDYPVSHAAGDIDKLLRLVLDALQDTPVLPDDCAVVEVTARKAYPRTTQETWGDVLGYPGVVIRLYPLEDT